MKIVVIGGTGRIGSKVVEKLRAYGHDALPASPGTGVDVITGDGLAAALQGAQVVVDVSNAPDWSDAAVMDFFQTSAGNIRAAEAAAGVGHHVALSVVGTEHLQGSGYFRAKLAQEEALKAGPIPYTILRATQFFEFIAAIADFGTQGKTVLLPPVLFQPESADDVAEALADIAGKPPVNDTVELGGPERFRLDDLVRSILSAMDDPRRVVADIRAPYYGIVVEDEHALVPGEDSRIGTTHFADWLSQSAKRAPERRSRKGPDMEPTGESYSLHELEITVREELTVVESSPLEEESGDTPTAAWRLDPDGEQYEVSLRTLLGAVEAAEEVIP